MNTIKSIAFYLLLGAGIVGLSSWLKSDFLSSFLVDDLLTILITLLAINTATSGLLISNLRELSPETNEYFQSTYDEIKFSLIEQLALIGFTVLFVILRESIVLQEALKYHLFIWDTLLTACFIFGLDILRDTGVAIFNLLKVK